MKKLMYVAAFTLALGFTACNKDDDGNANCRECSVLTIPISICNNGDGTVNLTANGETEKVTLEEGVTFEQYANTLCSGTITLGF